MPNYPYKLAAHLRALVTSPSHHGHIELVTSFALAQLLSWADTARPGLPMTMRQRTGSLELLAGVDWFQFLMLDENVSPAADQPDSRAVGQPLAEWCWLGCSTQRMSGANTAPGPASPGQRYIRDKAPLAQGQGS
eukprot:1161135-Pelagomonas_calceolata.AAC.4